MLGAQRETDMVGRRKSRWSVSGGYCLSQVWWEGSHENLVTFESVEQNGKTHQMRTRLPAKLTLTYLLETMEDM